MAYLKKLEPKEESGGQECGCVYDEKFGKPKDTDCAYFCTGDVANPIKSVFDTSGYVDKEAKLHYTTGICPYEEQEITSYDVRIDGDRAYRDSYEASTEPYEVTVRFPITSKETVVEWVNRTPRDKQYLIIGTEGCKPKYTVDAVRTNAYLEVIEGTNVTQKSPGPVTNLDAEPLPDTREPVINIIWGMPEMKGEGVNKFYIYKNGQFLKIAEPHDRTFRDAHVSAGDNPKYCVTAQNQYGESDKECVHVDIKDREDTGPVKPSIPENLEAELRLYSDTKRPKNVLLTWEKPNTIGQGIQKYNIYEDENKVADTTDTEFVYDGISGFGTHTLLVTAVNADGEGHSSHIDVVAEEPENGDGNGDDGDGGGDNGDGNGGGDNGGDGEDDTTVSEITDVLEEHKFEAMLAVGGLGAIGLISSMIGD